MNLEEAEAILRADGNYEWLLNGPEMWFVKDIAQGFAQYIGVPRGDDTILKWIKQLPERDRLNFGGNTGFRARRSALIIFFAQGGHLH